MGGRCSTMMRNVCQSEISPMLLNILTLSVIWLVSASLAPAAPPEVAGQPSERGIGDFPKLSADNDWPWWRGPKRNGLAASEAPVRWSETEGIAWKVELPGR